MKSFAMVFALSTLLWRQSVTARHNYRWCVVFASRMFPIVSLIAALGLVGGLRNADAQGCPPLYTIAGQAAFDNLGHSVAGVGDVNGDGYADFIIGALDASPGGVSTAGSVYVYSGLDGTLLYEKAGAAAGYRLGYSVAGAGDVNGDGLTLPRFG